jgi:hypothetical protein
MRSANRDSSNNPFLTFPTENFPSSIPLPPSPEVKQQPQSQQEEEFQLPPFDLNKVTGKKTLFESSDSDDEEGETTSEPQVPVSLSVSEPRAVPDGFNQNQPPSLPMPSSSSSSATLDAIKTRVANLIHPPTSSSHANQSNSTTQIEDDEDENEDQPPVMNPERTQAISAKFNRKRRKVKRNKKKKNPTHSQIAQELTNENEPTVFDQEEAWKRHVAMQLQFSFLKKSDPVLRALTAEAHKKLGVSQDEVNGQLKKRHMVFLYHSAIFYFFKNFNSMKK